MGKPLKGDFSWWMIGMALGLGLLLDAGQPLAQSTLNTTTADTQATQLKARYTDLRPQLASNAFGRPLVLDSTQTTNELKGDIHAVVDHPFVAVNGAVGSAAQWCEILILHLNVKHCQATTDKDGELLTAYLGRKNSTSLSGAHKAVFRLRPASVRADYVQVRLQADSGPMGTSDYRIVLEAVPLDARRTFVHLSYAYSYGVTAAFAMRTYFNTAGGDKVGFTVVDTAADGKPVHVGDVRGALERNTMRYFLALDATLDAANAPDDARVEKRLRNWFAATERYPQQLHELEQAEYLALKRDDIKRVVAQR